MLRSVSCQISILYLIKLPFLPVSHSLSNYFSIFFLIKFPLYIWPNAPFLLYQFPTFCYVEYPFSLLSAFHFRTGHISVFYASLSRTANKGVSSFAKQIEIKVSFISNNRTTYQSKVLSIINLRGPHLHITN